MLTINSRYECSIWLNPNVTLFFCVYHEELYLHSLIIIKLGKVGVTTSNPEAFKRPKLNLDYSEFVADGDKDNGPKNDCVKDNGPKSDCTEAHVDVESFPNDKNTVNDYR